ncbi:hypothetical protein [Mycobacterium sp. 1274761.0]|uniref:hypothetical protein n=1 Tax=Mycobacterium sp. 1274761.0 TaxID=1834077 RepID=UPI0008018F50|nr:hypothetical protein [Mycobacterium sp. 1274761.0]OBK71174.1 hypothetical protein A5651_19275 [Mycobacterium sp. 1274761.0]
MLAVDAADLVTWCGGLICDSVRAGLIVQVGLESLDDDLALRILGVDAFVLPDVLDFEHWPDAIYFAAELHERNSYVRRLVVDAARRHSADVAAWGGSQWLGTASGRDVTHRLSSAAQMFKREALRAVGAMTRVAAVEPFHCGQRRTVDAIPFPCG